jgi:hypothetical protein
MVIFFNGLIALVIDRVVLRPQGGPESASAGSYAVSGDTVSPTTDTAGSQPEPERPDVAARLNSLWSDNGLDSAEIRDPFSLPPDWLGGNADAGAPATDPASVFAKTHQLAAVVRDGRESYVLVGDHFLRPGQGIDGFKLVSVADRAAVFERDGVQVTLQLKSK